MCEAFSVVDFNNRNIILVTDTREAAMESAEVYAEQMCKDAGSDSFRILPVDTANEAEGGWGTWRGDTLEVYRTYKKEDGWFTAGAWRTKTVGEVLIVPTDYTTTLEHDDSSDTDDADYTTTGDNDDSTE
jgi:hypothetical protein